MKSKLLSKTFAVMEELSASKEPSSLKTLSARLKINASTLSRIAADLVEAGYIRKASYHAFEPSLGLMRLGQKAMLNCYLPRKINKLIQARCKAAKLNGAISGVFKDHVVYLYNSAYDDLPDRGGLPYAYDSLASNTAVAALFAKLGKAKALEMIRMSLRSKPDIDAEGVLKSCSARMDQLKTKGYSFFDEIDCWNVSMPIPFQDDVFGLSLFASPRQAGSKERLVMETSFLANKIKETLLNRAVS